MSRWAPGAAGRLRDAAMQLFLEQGFGVTTVPQIAERAGLTTRSFFRHFADKREVLFAGEEELPEVVAQVFAAADPGLGPFEVIAHGMLTVLGPHLEPLRDDLLARRRIIDTDAGLQERQLRKLTLLHEAAARGFRNRGLPPLQADLAARFAVLVFDATSEDWLGHEGRSFVSAAAVVLDALPRATLLKA